MLLTKEEVNVMRLTSADAFELVAKAEAAIMAKLASSELPANASHITRRIRACESEVPALIVFEHAWRQAYAQGAAAQLSDEPTFFYRPTCNGEMYEGPHHACSVGGRMLREEKPTEWVALYTRRQA